MQYSNTSTLFSSRMQAGKDKCFDDYFFDIQIIVDASGSIGKNFKPMMKVRTTFMDVPQGAYGAYAYAPGVGLRMASDCYCYGVKEKISHELREKERFSL